VAESDPELPIDRIITPARSFWVKRTGDAFDGKGLIAYLLAEQRWVERTNGHAGIRNGDVVLDCGGHVGTFTHYALERGASRVIAVEPDPVNLECFRRNFRTEIEAGRVILTPQGVWHEETVLELFEGADNSGTNSVVWKHGGNKVTISVTTIDKLVSRLKLDRLDVIKMDIEGAERNALRGASETLRRFRPRVLLDSYHLPDDGDVLPAILYAAHRDYRMTCGPCQPSSHSDKVNLVPHATWFE
jgi:FkbM family methyltransferase